MNLRGKSRIVGVTSEMDEMPFRVELVAGANHSYSVQLEAFDDVDPAANEKRTANR